MNAVNSSQVDPPLSACFPAFCLQRDGWRSLNCARRRSIPLFAWLDRNQVAVQSAHRTSTTHLNRSVQACLLFLIWKGTHVGLSAAVERNPPKSSPSPEGVGKPSFTVRIERAQFHRARSAQCSQGWGLIDLPLRVSNEGNLRPRVARAREINSLHARESGPNLRFVSWLFVA